jgi:hypothetical protein
VKALHEGLFVLAIWPGQAVTVSIAADPLSKPTHELLAPIGLQYLTRAAIRHDEVQCLASILTGQACVKAKIIFLKTANLKFPSSNVRLMG